MDCQVCQHPKANFSDFTQSDIDKLILYFVSYMGEGYIIYEGSISGKNVKIVHTILDKKPFLLSPQLIGYWECQDGSVVFIYDQNTQNSQNTQNTQSVQGGSSILLPSAFEGCPYNDNNRIVCERLGLSKLLPMYREKDLKEITVGEQLYGGGFTKFFLGEKKDEKFLVKYYQRKTIGLEDNQKLICIQNTAAIDLLSPVILGYWDCPNDWSVLVMSYTPGKTVKTILNEGEIKEREVKEIYLGVVEIILKLNLGNNITLVRPSLDNFIYNKDYIKLIDFTNAFFEGTPNKLENTLKEGRIIKPGINEYLNTFKSNYNYFADISKVTTQFISLCTYTYPMFAYVLYGSRLDDPQTLFSIYSGLMGEKKLYPKDALSEISKLL